MNEPIVEPYNFRQWYQLYNLSHLCHPLKCEVNIKRLLGDYISFLLLFRAKINLHTDEPTLAVKYIENSGLITHPALKILQKLWLNSFTDLESDEELPTAQP